MIDYNNFVDGVARLYVVNQFWYIMWASPPKSIIFTYFPIDQSLIKTEDIKSKAIFLQPPNYYVSSQLYGAMHVNFNTQLEIVDIVSFVIPNSRSQIEISYFDLQSNTFMSSYFLNIQGNFLPNLIYYK